MEIADKDLIARYRCGDTEALEVLVQKYRRPLFSFILNMVQNSHDADEIFQESWFKAIRGMKSYRHKSFISWMFRISRNLVIDRARKKKPDLILDQEIGEGGAKMLDFVANDKHDAVAELEGRETGELISVAVARLPEEQKEVFLMRKNGELSFKEIAEIHGVSINTALARMQYAIQKLREDLKEIVSEA